MAIISVWDEGDIEHSEETTGRGPVRIPVRKYGVEAEPGDDPHEIMAAIITHPGIPSRLALCPWDVTSICRSRKITQDSDAPWIFHVELQYSNQPLDGEKPDQDNDENPLNRPSDISWDSEEVLEALTKDLDNVPILNSARQCYSQAVTAERRRRVITIVKNQETYNDITAEAYEGCVNSVSFLSKAAGKVYCKKISARRTFESNIYFFVVTYVFVYDSLGWKTRVVDVGTAEWIDFGDGYVHVPIHNNDGSNITAEVLLNGSGLRATGSPPTPYIKEYRTKNTANFNDLNL